MADKVMAARIGSVEDMLKQLLAQGQPSAPAAATPAQDSTAELRQRIQDLEEHKAR